MSPSVIGDFFLWSVLGGILGFFCGQFLGSLGFFSCGQFSGGIQDFLWSVLGGVLDFFCGQFLGFRGREGGERGLDPSVVYGIGQQLQHCIFEFGRGGTMFIIVLNIVANHSRIGHYFPP